MPNHYPRLFYLGWKVDGTKFKIHYEITPPLPNENYFRRRTVQWLGGLDFELFLGYA